MKRWLSTLLAALLALSLTACGSPEPPPEEVRGPAVEAPLDRDAPEEAPEDGGEEEAPPEEVSPEEALWEDGEAGSPEETLPEDGTYSTKEDVALYLHLYGHLPENFITKKEAQALGWSGGSLEPYAPGKCIGGSHFGNYEGLLPEAEGRSYTECDIDTLGADRRGAKRIVFSNDGLIYYTGDHYASFTLLYGEDSDG